MNIKAVSVAGWVVAAALGTVLLAGGFQNGQTKIGVVDISKAIQDSDAGKKATQTFQAMVDARDGLLKYCDKQGVLTTEQAVSLRALTLKENPTEADKKEIEKIKADVDAAAKQYNDLNLKKSPTKEDSDMLVEYNQRAQKTRGALMEWQQEFRQDLANREQTVRNDLFARAKTAVNEVSKSQGYTVVFESSVAVYCANDLTEAAVKAMNAKK